ncbi:thiamine pyrophosphate-binding protein [Streptomyces sp. SAS_267]|uniref:thiamine pyrophosphate-binding protein n=1 Tax=Streptomyces sp. SAS_267 TaxID=3412750 RepID=UPI00403CCFE2
MGRRPALALLDILRGEGVDRVFGNPGTTELPFLTALAEAENAPEYVVGVHDGAVVSMATATPAYPAAARPRFHPPVRGGRGQRLPHRPDPQRGRRIGLLVSTGTSGRARKGSRSRRESRPRVRTP